MSRKHHEAQIKRFGPHYSRTVSDAIGALAFRNGLSWFTDEQVADIREVLILDALRGRRNNAANRRFYQQMRELANVPL